MARCARQDSTPPSPSAIPSLSIDCIFLYLAASVILVLYGPSLSHFQHALQAQGIVGPVPFSTP